jgi:hypothetical protein
MGQGRQGDRREDRLTQRLPCARLEVHGKPFIFQDNLEDGRDGQDHAGDVSGTIHLPILLFFQPRRVLQ